MAAPINVRWRIGASTGGRHYIYADECTHPLLILNMSGTKRAGIYTEKDIEDVLQHIVAAHNAYLDSEAAWDRLKLK